MSDKLKVAIIGLGNIGKAVASNLVRGNRSVIIAEKTMEKSEKIAGELGPDAVPREVSAAIAEADIVLPAIYFNSIKEFLATYKNELKGKIIVDPSNPIAPEANGGFKKIIGEKESAGEILSGLIPAGAKLVKAFGSLSAASLTGAAFNEPRKVLFYASDDRSVDSAIEQLIADSGFDHVRAGNLNKSIRLEVFGDLHEYGPLGKPVTAAEAKARL